MISSVEKWEVVRLGELAEYINGAAFKPTDWGDQGLPIIRIQNLTDPSKAFNRTTRVVSDRLRVQNGDLLVSWSATLDAFVWDRGPAWLNQHIFKVVPNRNRVDKDFLFLLLKREIALLIETEHLHGSTMKHINRGPFLAHKVSIPPIPEQRRIVTVVTSLLSKSKTASDELGRVPKLVDRYKQALFRRCFARATSEIALGSLISEGPQNGLYLPKTAYGSGTPILRIEDFGFDEARSIHKWKRVRLPPDQSGRYDLIEGDIVINRVNSPSHLGKSLLISKEHLPAVFESNMMRIHLKPAVVPAYAQAFLSCDYGRRRLTENAKWAVNQASINQGDVLSVQIPMLDIPDQLRVVDEMSSLIGRVTSSLRDHSAAKKLVGRLEQAILRSTLFG